MAEATVIHFHPDFFVGSPAHTSDTRPRCDPESPPGAHMPLSLLFTLASYCPRSPHVQWVTALLLSRPPRVPGWTIVCFRFLINFFILSSFVVLLAIRHRPLLCRRGRKSPSSLLPRRDSSFPPALLPEWSLRWCWPRVLPEFVPFGSFNLARRRTECSKYRAQDIDPCCTPADTFFLCIPVYDGSAWKVLSY